LGGTVLLTLFMVKTYWAMVCVSWFISPQKRWRLR